MKPLSLMFRSAIAFSLMLQGFGAHAEPSEKTSAQLTRAAGQDVLTANLSRNMYRTEQYQDNYEVSIPYEDTETYYVDVPYEDTETYIDQETYYTTEQICRDVNRPQEQCENVRRCQPRTEQRCEDRRVCGHASLGSPLMQLLFGTVAHAQIRPGNPGGGNGDQDRQERERQENERRQQDEQRRQERERQEQQRQENDRRQREEGERRQREENDRRQREEGERRQREENDRRQREEGERRQREENDRRQREEGERRQREENDRRQREEGERRQREENDRRQREEGERRQREERDRQDRDRREREERERRERENQCHMERQCTTVNAGEDCRDDRVCRQVPHMERECHNEQVPHQRNVTRTRTVTRYRSEARTRTVTRYRSETRCCVTRSREVYDHQYGAAVEVQFPANALLDANEKETVTVALKGAEATADLKVTMGTQVYKYEPQVTRQGDKFIVAMKLVPSYTAEQLGEKTLDGIKLLNIDGKLHLSWVDKGAVKKVQTDYAVTITNVATNAVIVQDQFASVGSQQFDRDLNVAVANGTNVRIDVAVARQGIVIAAPVAFTKSATLVLRPGSMNYDPKKYIDSAQVSRFSMNGQKEKMTLLFSDLTVQNEMVQTEYVVKLTMKVNKKDTVVGQGTFDRKALPAGEKGQLRVSLVNELKIAATEIAKWKAKSEIVAEVQVVRYGARFKDGVAKFTKKASLKVP